MLEGTALWLTLTLTCVAIQSFYSMLEMAIVSFNRVRLQYYVSQKIKRAQWIANLLQNPSRLFGTTLLGVNIALQIGSECSRMFYSSLDLDPDLAPLTQIVIVMIFAELSPMFAARRYVEHVAMLGIPIIFATSKLLAPFIWIIGWILKGVAKVFGGKKTTGLSALSREELQTIMEDYQEAEASRKGEFDTLVSNLFSFRTKMAKDAMTPLPLIKMLPSNAQVTEVKTILRRFDVPCFPLYFRSFENIVAIASPRDLVRIPEDKKVIDFSKPPWFITADTPLMQILTQFRYNNQTVAVVLDPNGQALGLLTLDDILDEIFGEQPPTHRLLRYQKRKHIERQFPGDMTIEEFNQKYGASFNPTVGKTLSDLMIHKVGHLPDTEESVKIEDYLLTATEVGLRHIKTVLVRSLD